MKGLLDVKKNNFESFFQTKKEHLKNTNTKIKQLRLQQFCVLLRDANIW